QTPFVRQNTPHPKELKAKAHKLFAKGQTSLEESDLQQSDTVCDAVNQVVRKTPEPVEVKLHESITTRPEPETIVGNGNEECSDASADEDGDDAHVTKRVGFKASVLLPEEPDASRPIRLHRRDTPHHLKNKRINPSVDKEKLAIITKVA
ncbi:hypothetical protein AMK59_826, partial [Oryctes borbonicus]